MKAESFFSDDYSAGRRAFLDAAAEAGAPVATFENAGAKGPGGEALTTDTVRFGNGKTDRLIIATSGTHGVEGFCGSGCLVGILRAGLYRDLPDGLALVLVHAINPYGFAHLRRVNEDNVDLNRNIRDHDAPHPSNPDYAEVHPILVPADWDGAAKKAADEAIDAYIAERGQMAFQAAVSGGQYEYADGLFYGGVAPTWSNRTWRGIISEHAAGCSRIAHLDFHTGLGPYGVCEPISVEDPGSPGLKRARDWFGDRVKTPADGDSASAVVQGVMSDAFADEAPDAELTAIALEYGTLPVLEVLESLRADNWMHLHGDPASPQGKAISRQVRDAFYGDEPEWKRTVFDQAVEYLQGTYKGLGAA